jgi:hypothetical protein
MESPESARYKKESQHKANGRKRFTLPRLPALERMLGGAAYDEAGRLRLIANITKADFENLFSSRRDRLARGPVHREALRGGPEGR